MTTERERQRARLTELIDAATTRDGDEQEVDVDYLLDNDITVGPPPVTDDVGQVARALHRAFDDGAASVVILPSGSDYRDLTEGGRAGYERGARWVLENFAPRGLISSDNPDVVRRVARELYETFARSLAHRRAGHTLDDWGSTRPVIRHAWYDLGARAIEYLTARINVAPGTKVSATEPGVPYSKIRTLADRLDQRAENAMSAVEAADMNQIARTLRGLIDGDDVVPVQPEVEPGTTGWAWKIHAYRRGIRVNDGYVLVDDAGEFAFTDSVTDFIPDPEPLTAEAVERVALAMYPIDGGDESGRREIRQHLTPYVAKGGA